MKREIDPSTSGLLFRWNDRPASFWRLLPYLALCLAVLTGFFILFKISYPISDPTPRSTQGILMLDPDQPTHQYVLNRAYDRSALFLKPEAAADSLQAGVPLLPLFRPSFQGYQMQLKEPSQPETVVTSQRLFQPTDLALPQASSFNRSSPPPLPTPRSAPTFALQVRFAGALAARPILRPPDLTGLSPQELSRLRFHLTVNSSGRVVLALPVSGTSEDRSLIPALQTALSGIRFAPLPQAGNQTDLTTFVWQPQTRRD
jgi:hypothetical protein